MLNLYPEEPTIFRMALINIFEKYHCNIDEYSLLNSSFSGFLYKRKKNICIFS